MEKQVKNLKLISTLILIVLLVSACGSSSGNLTIQDAWARPASKGDNGAAYFVVENGTAADDTLLSVSSTIATASEVHMSMADSNGVMSMRMQESIPIPARGQVEFKPGGLHVMFVNLTRDLKMGDTITLVLNFENTGSLTIDIPVKAP